MTAHELAKILLSGPDVMVVVRRYKAGVNEVIRVTEVKPLYLNYYDESWYGDHAFVNPDYNNERAKDCRVVNAIEIEG